MASFSQQPHKGPHYEFVNGLPKDYECPVCLDAVYGAKQTTCCGHHLCESCSDRLVDVLPCPMCKTNPLVTTVDVYFRRKLNDLEVYCPHRGKMYIYDKEKHDPEKVGLLFWRTKSTKSHCRLSSSITCSFKCELRNIQSHLDKDCPLQPVTCKYKCNHTDLIRYEVNDHENDACRERPYKCSYCPYKAKAFEIEKHNEACSKVPVICPNKCEYVEMPRESLKTHLTQCPFQKVSCEFAYAGCTVRPKRKEYEVHVEECVKSHLKLLASYGARKDKEIEDMKNRLDKLEAKLR